MSIKIEVGRGKRASVVDAAEFMEKHAKRWPGPVPLPGIPSDFDLVSAALDMTRAFEGIETSVLTIRNTPKYMKVMMSDWHRGTVRDQLGIPVGMAWSAALEHGLHRLKDHPTTQLWIEAIAALKDDAGELPLATRVRLHKVIESPDVTVPDPAGGGRESLSFRIPAEVKIWLYRILNVVYLPGKTATVALPCIAIAMAHQQGVGEEASWHLEQAFEALVGALGEATDDLETITRGFADA